MTNPLLDLENPCPRFDSIKPEHVEPAIRQRIAELEAWIENDLDAAPRTWEGVMLGLQKVDEALCRAWDPVGHLNAVANTPELREAYETARPLVTEIASKLGQEPRLKKAIDELVAKADELGLDAVQRRILAHKQRDFRLAGFDLDAAGQERFRAIEVELGKLSTQFQNNLIDEAKDFRLLITDPAKVEGLPDGLLAMARKQALDDDAEAGESAWAFTLHAPSLRPFLQYQSDRALRAELHKAYSTRASTGERDNALLIEKILELRHEKAQLLGFANYAELSLVRKMAETPEEVHAFLSEMVDKAKPFGEKDIAAIREIAAKDGVDDLASYDYAYYREKLRQERYDLSDEVVRQYFPLPRVMTGLTETVRRLYGLELKDVTADPAFQRWHESVQVWALELDGELRGHVMSGFFARDGKRGGAWMNTCVDRVRSASGTQTPIAYVVCNFSPPEEGKPSLLRHDEVRTLFHEFGHAMHHVLTQVDHRDAAGINEVPWDGVELPSQFHENWIWQSEALSFISGHHQTEQPLPADLLETLLAAKNEQSGRDCLRQLVFGVFDLELHMRYTPDSDISAQAVYEEVRDRIALLPSPDYDRFPNGFGHIFAGGYAAGYYSYLWALVLSADAFGRFEEEGIFSPEAGAAFRQNILEAGGSAELMDLFVSFRGRKPTPDAFLRHQGLVEVG